MGAEYVICCQSRNTDLGCYRGAFSQGLGPIRCVGDLGRDVGLGGNLGQSVHHLLLHLIKLHQLLKLSIDVSTVVAALRWYDAQMARCQDGGQGY